MPSSYSDDSNGVSIVSYSYTATVSCAPIDSNCSCEFETQVVSTKREKIRNSDKKKKTSRSRSSKNARRSKKVRPTSSCSSESSLSAQLSEIYSKNTTANKLSREERTKNVIKKLKEMDTLKAQEKSKDLERQLAEIRKMRDKDLVKSKKSNSKSKSKKSSKSGYDSATNNECSSWNSCGSWKKAELIPSKRDPPSWVAPVRFFEAIDNSDYRDAIETIKEVDSKLRKTADLLPTLVAMLPKEGNAQCTVTSTDVSKMLELIQAYLPKLEAKLHRQNHTDDCIVCDDCGKCT